MSGVVGTLGGRDAMGAYGRGQAAADGGRVAALRDGAERNPGEDSVPGRLPGDVVSITPEGRQDDVGAAADVARPMRPADDGAPVGALTRRAANRAYGAAVAGSRPVFLSGRV